METTHRLPVPLVPQYRFTFVPVGRRRRGVDDNSIDLDLCFMNY